MRCPRSSLPGLPPSVTAGVFSVFVWCVSLITAALHRCNFCPLSALCLCCSVSKRCLLMFLCCFRRSEDRKLIPRRFFKQISHARQSCKISQQILDICHQVPIYSLFKPPSGILWSELSAFPFIHCSHNKLVLFSSLLFFGGRRCLLVVFLALHELRQLQPSSKKKDYK